MSKVCAVLERTADGVSVGRELKKWVDELPEPKEL